jgi:hypothetical protein
MSHLRTPGLAGESPIPTGRPTPALTLENVDVMENLTQLYVLSLQTFLQDFAKAKTVGQGVDTGGGPSKKAPKGALLVELTTPDCRRLKGDSVLIRAK